MCRAIVVLICLGMLLMIATAAPPHRGVSGPSCLNHFCDRGSGPVCAVDDTGLPRTFENRCMADLAYCRFGTYFAVVKPGEC